MGVWRTALINLFLFAIFIAVYQSGLLFSAEKNTDVAYFKYENAGGGALWHFKMAAWKGRQDAYYSIGKLYFNGRNIDQSVENAVKWWTRGAEKKDPRSILALADLYASSSRVDKNGAEAIRLYKEAQVLGVKSLEYKIGYLEARQSGDEKAQTEMLMGQLDLEEKDRLEEIRRSLFYRTLDKNDKKYNDFSRLNLAIFDYIMNSNNNPKHYIVAYEFSRDRLAKNKDGETYPDHRYFRLHAVLSKAYLALFDMGIVRHPNKGESYNVKMDYAVNYAKWVLLTLENTAGCNAFNDGFDEFLKFKDEEDVYFKQILLSTGNLLVISARDAALAISEKFNANPRTSILCEAEVGSDLPSQVVWQENRAKVRKRFLEEYFEN